MLLHGAGLMAGFTSHDVRKLHLCSECGQLGAYTAALANRIDAPLLVKVGRRGYAHPRCLRVELLVLLGQEQLAEVRLGDVPARTMETILLSFANRGSQSGRS